jgi:hypothetical protein
MNMSVACVEFRYIVYVHVEARSCVGIPTLKVANLTERLWGLLVVGDFQSAVGDAPPGAILVSTGRLRDGCVSAEIRRRSTKPIGIAASWSGQ